jgi:D-erythronate 2-dehydrogenase
VRFAPNEAVSRIVGSWPGRIDNSRALQLGFRADTDFDSFITQYLAANRPQAS